MRAVRAVFDSWDTPRAQVYRRANEIPDDIGTAVNVVQMVFGNKGERSGTGVAFTRNPSTGEKELYGEFLVERPGRGRRRRHPHAAAGRVDGAGRCPRPTSSCSRRCGRLEEHYRDMQDVEFTVEDGRALHAPDPRGEAHRRGRAEGGRRDGRRGPDRPRGGGRSGSIPASSTSSCIRGSTRTRRPEPVAKGLNASPGAASGGDRLRRRHRRRAGEGAARSSSSATRRRPTTSTG